MIRVTLPCSRGHHTMYVAVDEGSGAHVEECVEGVLSPADDEATWAVLEGRLLGPALDEAKNATSTYAGLRGTTVCGSTRLVDDKLQLRFGLDLLTVDYATALVMRKALDDYLGDRDPVTTVVDLTPYKELIVVTGDHARFIVIYGRMSLSERVDLRTSDMLLREPERRRVMAERMLQALRTSMPAEVAEGMNVDGLVTSTPGH